MNEWELVIWDEEVQRGTFMKFHFNDLLLIQQSPKAVTAGRVYSNHADTTQYKTIFDDLRKVTLTITDRALKLKRLSADGTLLSIGVDLELAQVKGACLSFAETNEPEYSKIVVDDIDDLATYFIRACYAHGKR